MAYEATQRIVRRAQRQLWLQGLIDRWSIGLMLAAVVLAICASLHTFHAPVPITWWGPAALLAAAAPMLLAVLDKVSRFPAPARGGRRLRSTACNRRSTPLVPLASLDLPNRGRRVACGSMPSPGPAAAALDRWLDTHGLFSAVCFLNSQGAAPSTTTLVVREQAERIATVSADKCPGLVNPFTPLRAAITVTVAAVSLFLLSLHGAVESVQNTASLSSEQLAREEARADSWVAALEDMARAGTPTAGGRPIPRNAPGEFSGSSGPPRRVSASGADPAEPSEPGSDSPSGSRLLLPGRGGDVGPAASMEPSRGTTADEFRESDHGPGELKILNVPRKSAARTTAVDHRRGIGLLPADRAPQGLQIHEFRTAAAQPVNEPSALALGPAQRALQFRYFNEAVNGD